jgi:hypothetical protein
MADATGIVIGAHVLLSAWEWIGFVTDTVGLELDTLLFPLLCDESCNPFPSALLPCAHPLVAVFTDRGPCI